MGDWVRAKAHFIFDTTFYQILSIGSYTFRLINWFEFNIVFF